ncbi:MAG: PepSY domain-containing protein [Rhizobacter sp.]|nr:PepSY domain-containing protein [Rhizobacter sp.]
MRHDRSPRVAAKALAAALCALSIMAAAPARADIGRDEAAAAAQRVASGRVLSVERIEADHRPVWRVKILTANGDVRVVLVDAATGRVVG